MRDASDLEALLLRIDGRNYGAYREIRGHFALPRCELYVDHVQADPFAAPSKLRARVPIQGSELPERLRANPIRRLALGDFLARELRRAFSASRKQARSGGERPTRRGSGRSGELEIDAGRQEVLERSALRITPHWVEVRVQVGLPAAGRRVLGREAAQLLCETLPDAVSRALLWRNLPQERAVEFVQCIENQEHIRGELERRGLLAFVANGSTLPRESGASDRPLTGESVVPFESPPSLELRIDLPNPTGAAAGGRASITGMGIPRGVTLLAGGGYHGKTTLLRALERGVYPHVPGDGREYVVSVPELVKIRAEDGRFVTDVDIQPFIDGLPGARPTDAFCSDDASGSTSQAANIIEALEAGARGLLLDEDTCASNFMVRDARMQALVPRDREPITPFLDRVRELYERRGVSTVLVMGGCGDYFEVADRVIVMHDYRPAEATELARRIAGEHAPRRRSEARRELGDLVERVPLCESFDASRGRRDVRIDARGCEQIRFGEDSIDLRGLEQLVDPSQTRALGLAVLLASRRFMHGTATLRQVLDELETFLDERGLDLLDPTHRAEQHPGRLARPRRFEIAAAINRFPRLRVRQVRAAPHRSA